MRRFWNGNTHYHPLVLASLPPGTARVLDVGCGDGILAADLVDAGVARVVGIDVDAPVLERARTTLFAGQNDHPRVTHEKTFDRAAGRVAMPEEATGKNAGVVEDEQVAGAQEPLEVCEHRVLDGASVAAQHQQPRPPALLRFLRDQRLGKLEIEIGNLHDRKNIPRLVRPFAALSGFHRSPTLAIRARTLSRRKASMATPFSTSAHVIGVDTDAVAVGRTE